MTRRARTLAGILAFTAMAFSFTEAVVAATCAPMPDMAMADGDRADEPGCPFHAAHDGGERDAPTDGSPHCPFSPVSGSACTAVASLPAPPAAQATLPAEVVERLALEEAHPRLLLVHALYHPPRA